MEFIFWHDCGFLPIIGDCEIMGYVLWADDFIKCTSHTKGSVSGMLNKNPKAPTFSQTTPVGYFH